jgi:RNA polymerase sigma factor (sigma-70 family)
MYGTNLVGADDGWPTVGPVLKVERSLAMGSGGDLVPKQVVETHRTNPNRFEVNPSTDDDDLIRVVAEAMAGSGEAWEDLVERFGGLVAAIARRCRLSEADVAEVCQTTWLRLVENIHRIEQPERLGGWLATTSRRESLRIATRGTMVSASEAVNFMADEEVEPPDTAILLEEQVRAVRMAADRLPERCQRLLGLLMRDDELPYKEIAEQLSMPIGSIGPTRGRCLDHLRHILDEMQLVQMGAAG